MDQVIDINNATISFDMGWAEDGDIDLNYFDVLGTDRNEDTRYMRPKVRTMKEENVKFKYAQDLAREVHVQKGERYNTIVAGNFIFGDFIEAYLTEHDIKATHMHIATLSYSEANLISLKALMDNGYIEQLDIIISALFYGHERWKVIPMTYEMLDTYGRFQLSVVGHHMKVCIFETDEGEHIVISGSANLRSSGSIEQFTIEESEELYNFYLQSFEGVIKEYKTINKLVNHERAWKAINNEGEQ